MSEVEELINDTVVSDGKTQEAMAIFYDKQVSCHCCDIFFRVLDGKTRASVHIKLDYNMLCIMAQCLPFTISSVFLVLDIMRDLVQEIQTDRIVSFWHVFYHFFFNECFNENKKHDNNDDYDDDDIIDMETRRVVSSIFYHIHRTMRLEETLRHPRRFNLSDRGKLEELLLNTTSKLSKHNLFNTRQKCCDLAKKKENVEKQGGGCARKRKNPVYTTECGVAAKYIRDKISRHLTNRRRREVEPSYCSETIKERSVTICKNVLAFIDRIAETERLLAKSHKSAIFSLHDISSFSCE